MTVTEEEQKRFDSIIKEHKEQINMLYTALTTGKDGKEVLLSKDRFKVIMEKYGSSDQKLDHNNLFERFDASGSPDGNIDEKEFGWFLAATAEKAATKKIPADDIIGDVVWNWYEKVNKLAVAMTVTE